MFLDRVDATLAMWNAHQLANAPPPGSTTSGPRASVPLSPGAGDGGPPPPGKRGSILGNLVAGRGSIRQPNPQGGRRPSVVRAMEDIA